MSVVSCDEFASEGTSGFVYCGDEGDSRLLEAVENSLADYLVDMFPVIPIDVVMNFIQSAGVSNKSQEFIVSQCLEYCSEKQSFENEDQGNNNSFNKEQGAMSSHPSPQRDFSLIEECNVVERTKNKNRKEETIAQDVFGLVNEMRNQFNCEGVKWDNRLARIAVLHSKNMAKKKIPPGHSGFKERALSLPLVCYQVGENVAVIRGYKHVAKSACVGWYHSNGHRTTMLDCYDYCGVGVYKSFGLFGTVWYITQLFARTTPIQGYTTLTPATATPTTT